MSATIVYVDRSLIRSSDLAGLRQAVTDLVGFVREVEPRILFYGFSIDAERRTMHVVAVHPDSASLELHLVTGGPAFRKVGAFIELQSIDVFGVASPLALERLHEKGRLLGSDVAISIHELASGLDRLPTVEP